MLLVSLHNHRPEDEAAVERLLRSVGEIVARVPTGRGETLLSDAPGAGGVAEELAAMPSVERVIRIASRYVLSASSAVADCTAVRITSDLVIGGREFVVIAGPCSVESETQTRTIGRAVRAAGARALRGGAF